MASWNDELTDAELYELAQLESSTLDAELEDNFAQVHSESESESEGHSESDSDSDFGLNDLGLAQQMQELNYLNALGTINAAQVQAMQSMGSMGTMGMGMAMPQMGQMAA